MRRKPQTTQPAALMQGQRRFERWRQVRRTGARIPERLWTMAVGLASEHGVWRTARALHLDYQSLKGRLAASPPAPRGGFVEVVGPALSGVAQCVVELEDRDGSRLRVELRGAPCPDLGALLKAFRDGGV